MCQYWGIAVTCANPDGTYHISAMEPPTTRSCGCGHMAPGSSNELAAVKQLDQLLYQVEVAGQLRTWEQAVLPHRHTNLIESHGHQQVTAAWGSQGVNLDRN